MSTLIEEFVSAKVIKTPLKITNIAVLLSDFSSDPVEITYKKTN